MAYVDSSEENLDENGNPVTSSQSATISSGAASTGGGGVGNASPKTATAGNVNLEEYLNANPGTAESIYNMVSGEASDAATKETGSIDTQAKSASDLAATAEPYAHQDTNSIITNAVNTNNFDPLNSLFAFDSNSVAQAPTLSTSTDYNTLHGIFSDPGATQTHWGDKGYINPQYGAMDTAFYGSGIERGRVKGSDALSSLDSYLGTKQGEVNNRFSGLSDAVQGTQKYAATALRDTYNNAVSGFNSTMNQANAGKTGTPSSLTLGTLPTTTTQVTPGSGSVAGDIGQASVWGTIFGPLGGAASLINSAAGGGAQGDTATSVTTPATGVSYTAGLSPYTASTYGGNESDRNTANVLAEYLGLDGLGAYTPPGASGSTPWLNKPKRNTGRI